MLPALTKVFGSDKGHLNRFQGLLPDQVALRARPSEIPAIGVGSDQNKVCPNLYYITCIYLHEI